MRSDIFYNVLFIVLVAPPAIGVLLFVGTIYSAVFDCVRTLWRSWQSRNVVAPPRRPRIPRRVDLRDEERVASWLERHDLAA